MSNLVHDILSKITIIKVAIWEAQSTSPQDQNLKIASQELSEVVRLIEQLNQSK